MTFESNACYTCASLIYLWSIAKVLWVESAIVATYAHVGTNAFNYTYVKRGGFADLTYLRRQSERNLRRVLQIEMLCHIVVCNSSCAFVTWKFVEGCEKSEKIYVGRCQDYKMAMKVKCLIKVLKCENDYTIIISIVYIKCMENFCIEIYSLSTFKLLII